MTQKDVPAAVRLSRQAGWNQTEADWLCFLELSPEACYTADRGDVLIGATITCTFGSVGWIAMVLVDPAERGQGVGTALTRHAVERLEDAGARTIRLDATPLGRPIYEKLGFTAQFELARYEGRPAPARVTRNAETASSSDFAQLVKLDERVTRTYRAKWLSAIFSSWPEAVRVARRDREVSAFIASRRGTHAIQVGPCVGNDESGALLFRDAAHRFRDQRVFVDIPINNVAASRQAESLELHVQRRLLRMCRGEAVCDDVDHLWASSGPELG